MAIQNYVDINCGCYLLRYNALLFALLRKIGGDPLNNLFRDCLNMLLEWTTDVPPSVDDVEFPKLASNVVQFIIKNMGNSKTEIARDNLVLSFFHVFIISQQM